jgi:hypothetical protein
MNKNIKPESEWKVKNHRIVECIHKECYEKPWSEGFCEKHLKENFDNEIQY